MTYNKTSAIWLLILYAAMILFACLMESCRSERVVTVPEYHTLVAHQRDTLLRTDSIYIHDSVATERHADTFFITRTRIEYRDRWRDRVRVDSVLRSDTVTLVRQVPTPLTPWQRAQLRVGKTVLLLGALATGAALLWLLGQLVIRRLRL